MTSLRQPPWPGQQTRSIMPPPSFDQTAQWGEAQQTIGLGPDHKPKNYSHPVVLYSYGDLADVYTQAQSQPWCDSRAQLHGLQKYYMIDGPDHLVEQLLESNVTLFALLTEAVQPLKDSFGDRLLHIRVQTYDDDSLLKVAVRLPAAFAEPEAALQAFDSMWWMKNCHRSTGALLFDYEIQDAV